MKRFTKYWVFGVSLYFIGIFLTLTALLVEENSYLPLVVITCNLVAVFFVYFSYDYKESQQTKFFIVRFIPLLAIYGAVGIYCNFAPPIVYGPILVGHGVFLVLGPVRAIESLRIITKWRIALEVVLVTLTVAQIISAINLIRGHITLIEISVTLATVIVANMIYGIIVMEEDQRHQSLKKDQIYLMADNALDILFYYTIRPARGFSFVSRSVGQVLGYKASEFYKNPKIFMELAHEEDRSIIEAFFVEEAATVNRGIVRLQKSDGDYAYMEFNNTPVITSGRMVAVEGILRDVTESVLDKKKIAAGVKARKLLLSYVSHELRTPITYIMGYAELLKGDFLSDQKEKAEAAELIFAKAQFLNKLVDDLFQLSKMEANQFYFDFMEVEVKELFDILKGDGEGQIWDKGMEFQCNLDPILETEGYNVLADIKRIRLVASNLINNGIKHTDTGGLITLNCFPSSDGKSIVVEVGDTGAGIDNDEVTNIFEPFYTGKNNKGENKGNGIGLSLCKQIVQAHKGIITVKSKKDQGSTFQFTLPLFQPDTTNN